MTRSPGFEEKNSLFGDLKDDFGCEGLGSGTQKRPYASRLPHQRVHGAGELYSILVTAVPLVFRYLRVTTQR